MDTTCANFANKTPQLVLQMVPYHPSRRNRSVQPLKLSSTLNLTQPNTGGFQEITTESDFLTELDTTCANFAKKNHQLVLQMIPHHPSRRNRSVIASKTAIHIKFNTAKHMRFPRNHHRIRLLNRIRYNLCQFCQHHTTTPPPPPPPN
ncbi:hypothetical protein ACOSQ3_031396 [Xanthoceras sorbifolium]